MAEHDPTDPQRVVLSGEAELPLEHTARVRAAKERRPPREEAPTKLTVHGDDDVEPEVPDLGPRADGSEAARRQRRRERDRRAERRAIQVVVALFLGIGGLAFLAVNALLEEPKPPAAPVAVNGAENGAASPGQGVVEPNKPALAPGVFASRATETTDLPVIRSMKSEGLTLAAEGIPEVLADEEGQDVALKAALETCRFAYGVWELSPNRRFRFLTTCPGLEGQILLGAYEVQGTVVRMSPLMSLGAELVTELQLEKPSQARTRVTVREGGRALELTVNQRLTTMRAGLEGEGFRDTYRGRNTLQVPGLRPPGAAPSSPRPAAPPPPAAPPARPSNDPLLELLRKQD